MKGLVRWLDRYIYVDRLRLRRIDVFPRMRPFEWAWYVAVLLASGPVLFWLWNRVGDWIASLPGGFFLNLLAFPIAAVLVGGVWLVVLPARRARLETVGEGWLIAALLAAGEALWALIGHALFKGL